MIAHTADEFDTQQWWQIEFEPLPDGLFRAVFPGPFQRAADRYRAAGWHGTLPLPAGAKNPPPTGYTGHKASHPTGERVGAWAGERTRRGANIALRLAGTDFEDHTDSDAFEIVGIDVDHYVKGGKVKRGGDQLAALVEKLGPLPDTWISSARVDGSSGIRYFRVPAGLTFRGQVAADIECIYRGHRFAVVWPSTNPDAGGQTYWWFRPDAPLTDEGRDAWNPATDALPNVADLPVLPDVWIDHLRNPRGAANYAIDADSPVDEVYAWADATFNDSAGHAMCARMTKSVRQQSEQIRREATSHDKIVKAHFHLYRLAAEGHTGWKAAIDQIESTYRDEVTARDKRGRDELRGEIFRSRTQALRKIKGDVDQNAAIGAQLVPTTCPCVVRGRAVDHNGYADPLETVRVDLGDFWSSSPQLADLRQFAHARIVGPLSMLGNTLARVVSAIPPEVVLPPIIGGHASLNLFVALVGRSGDSKSASMRASADWLRIAPDYAPAKPGSGEGLAKCFAYKTKATGGGWNQVGKQWSVLAQITEVDTLAATGGRGGATIMSTLREGWSGERLGLDYAGEDKRIVLMDNRYRLCLSLGVQPLRAAPLFDDADGGTPQRFVWFPTADPDIPDTEPAEPARLDLGRWEPTPNPTVDADTARNAALGTPVDPADFDVLDVPAIAREEVKATQRAIRRGTADVDPLDGHRLLVQLKIAAALMALEGRRHEITEADWQRARVVMAVSHLTRQAVRDDLASKLRETNLARGRAEGEREIVKTDVIAEERQRVFKMAERICEALKVENGQTLSKLRKNLASGSRNRDVFDKAVPLAVDNGMVRGEDFTARNGQDSTRLWVAT